ncbi:MAG TPA: LuxR C-terminal-related transcriptional regulator, partial [Myxococcota bacterium]|nr:LuxR C-terminal-related transcriptional regulator [Myxococcota bacterium]
MATDLTGTHALERLARLTPRRRELLELASLGLTNEQIAERLTISPATVRTHFTTIFSDLGVKNRTEAVALLLARPAASATELGPFMRSPAIAVLPIEAGTSEPTASFALAVGDELSSLFSRWCSFPVIARSSSRSGRVLGTTAAEIGQALGARFIVDGSLRVHGLGWRLQLQVDDAATGMILWSDAVDFA